MERDSQDNLAPAAADAGDQIGCGAAAAAGVIAASVALGATELFAGLVHGTPSLITAVGDRVVERAPGFVVRLGIDIFGTDDKTALLAVIVGLTGLAGAVFGVVARRRRWVAAIGFAAFAAIGIATAASEPGAEPGRVVAATALAADIGFIALLVLLRAARPALPPEDRADPRTLRMIDTGRSRRTFLAGAGALLAVAAASAMAGRVLVGRTVEAARAAVRLPRPTRRAGTLPTAASLDTRGVTPLVTTNDRFYRIDTALRTPRLEPDGWRLRVHGMVEQPYHISYRELLGLPMVEEYVTLACVSSEVGGNLVGTARWLGVPLATLLERARVRSGADQLVGRSVDGFTAGFPTRAALDGRTALLAVGMNGEPLPFEHGFPARLVIAGLYGYASATKWVTELELATFESVQGFWVERGWAQQAPIKPQTRIDVPNSGAVLRAGRAVIAGVAWAPTSGIERVELRVDRRPWVDADLAEPVNGSTWRQWVHRWDAAPGRHTIAARATDGQGRTQTHHRSDAHPDGATGYHTITVAVRAT